RARPRAATLPGPGARRRAGRADPRGASRLSPALGTRSGDMSTPVTQLPEVDVTATRLTPPGSGSGLVLRIEGTDYAGRLAIRVRRNLEQGAAEFACEVTERWPGKAQPWPIKPGDACQVLLDGQVVVSGFVDVYAPSFDARSHRVEVRGRSATADAYDSSIEM